MTRDRVMVCINGQMAKSTTVSNIKLSSHDIVSCIVVPGEYQNDKRQGHGVYKWPNGEVYEGE